MTEKRELLRPPAVAGSFYPAEPQRLAATIAGYLDEAAGRAKLLSIRLKAIIVPHAGYVYSGPIAASAYVLLRMIPGFRRVILLGPAHRVPLHGLAASGATHFDTPLGRIPVDGEALARIQGMPQLRVLEAAHAAEHSLEVQLPFLQSVLKDFSLVPLLAGEADAEEVAEVIERLWGGDETLVVISSDLSHYHDYRTAAALDRETTRAIEACDGAALQWESACGRVPVRGLLEVARKRHLGVHTLDVRNSGDTAGPRDSVVGYGAWAFTQAAAN